MLSAHQAEKYLETWLTGGPVPLYPANIPSLSP